MLSSLSRLLFVWDDDIVSKPAGYSGRLVEPAPPTYQEALDLRLFQREETSNSASGNGRRAGPQARTRRPLQDFQLAERLQQEEIERCRVARSGRSASVTAPPSDRSLVRASVTSAPGDFRPTARNPTYDLPHRNRLGTIPEGKLSKAGNPISVCVYSHQNYLAISPWYSKHPS